MVADGAIAFMRHQPCIGLVPFVIGLHPDFCSETSRRARKLILWRHPYYVAQMFTGRFIKLSQSHMFRARHYSYDAEITLSSQTVTKKYNSIKLQRRLGPVYRQFFYSALVGGGTVHAWDRSAERPKVAA
jgi:hypothetical protein